MSASRPFGTISRPRETFRSLVTTRSASRLPAKRRRDPTTVLILRRVATTWPALAGLKPIAVGLAAQITLSTPPHGMRQRRQTEALCACSPLRFSRHMAMGDRGLACPVNFPSASRYRRISPSVPSTTGLLTNQAYISRPAAHAGGRGFSPYPPRPVTECGNAGRCVVV